MASSFHPHSMGKKVERVTAKTGCTSCTKRTISFEVSGFHTETRLLQRDFIFLNLFELHSFYMFKMNRWKPHHQFTTLSDYICYFSCIYWLFWAMIPWNWNAFEMNSERFQVGMVSTFHPHSMCEKVRGLRKKLDALRVQNRQSFSKY